MVSLPTTPLFCVHAGIDDPYEVPEHPEIALNVNDAQGRRQSPEAMARIVLTYLEVLAPLMLLTASIATAPEPAIHDCVSHGITVKLFEGSRRLQKTAIIKAEGLAAISGLLLTSCRKHSLLP